uniref:Uncharacterized protein n=1 Tax=Parastrongyloides trichosuri TaxID=131310 RepID=A0A0N4ZX50_PARTI
MFKLYVAFQLVFLLLILEGVKFSIQKPVFSSSDAILSVNKENSIEDNGRRDAFVILKDSLPSAILIQRPQNSEDGDRAPLIKRAFNRVDSGYFGLGAKKRKRSFDRVDSGYFGLYKKAFDRVDSGYFGLKRK